MKIALLGCGNMGYAYAKSLFNKNIVAKADLLLFEKHLPRIEFLENEGIGTVHQTYSKVLSEADIIVLAVKPQGFGELAEEIKPYLTQSPLVLSIMAGVSSSIIERKLGLDKVVRAMPNTPCQIGFGITGFYVPDSISTSEKDRVKTILESTGNAVEVSEEKLIDAVTAVSGSGPAYYFYILQQMAQTGKELGLNPKDALLLASETMHGAYELMKSSELDLQQLIDAVTSKGGTTAAALDTFKSHKLDDTIKAGLNAAEKRAGELSKMLEE